MKKGLIAIPFLAVMVGCSSDIDMVKDGVMDFNKTTTLGEALDNWGSCGKREWESFETESGVKVVEFSCYHELSDFMEKARSIRLEKANDEAEYFNIDSMVQTFQFTINKDDTFQVDNVQARTTWNDSTTFEDSQQPVEQLAKAYRNEIAFNAEELDEYAVSQLSYVFSMIKAQAK